MQKTAQVTLFLASILTAQPAEFQVTVTKNVMLPMRDGVKLAADIYGPAGNEKYPVLLTRTPYDSDPAQSSCRKVRRRPCLCG